MHVISAPEVHEKERVYEAMSGMNRARLPLLLGCLLVVGLAVGGCRKDEQNRTLEFKKGTYMGKPDQNLTAEQLTELRYRANAQR
ncbi:MAG: hypothetical protein KAT39_05635 [Alphaproteobacteria bacterium]|nr:hypothetical protein [Alphaproteobacteria bacterium]